MWLFVVGLTFLCAGAVLSLLLVRVPQWASWTGAVTAVAGCVVTAYAAVTVLWSGGQIEVHGSWEVPGGSLALGIDPLSAAFLLPITLVVALAAVYGVPYLRISHGPSRPGLTWCYFNLLAATMLLVVTARNGVLFLLCWESMSLASFCLVLTNYQQASVRRAAWIYLTSMHLGTASLLVLFLLLGRARGSLDFDQLVCEPELAGVLFVLAVAGFGTKAGFMPLHVWLPEAHPAAPSHVSAVMSGVMIKTGIYGLLRTISYLPEYSPWYGWSLVGVGVLSGIGGVLFALAQHDLKRLLAYSSVENVGIITIGLGVGLLGMAYRVPMMAFLGIGGALFHVWNHSLFKSLLFLGTGAVQHAAGSRDLNQLGSLFKKMPVTGGTFLIGACAIAGLPPLNGFVSELMIYMAVLSGVADPVRSGAVPWALLSVLVIGSLALIGGLATACFTKAFGCAFLGEARTDAAGRAEEVEPAMRAVMIVLAGACLIVALIAPVFLAVLQPAIIAAIPTTFRDTMTSAAEAAGRPLNAVCLVFWILLSALGLLAWWRRRLLARAQVARGPTWDCGYAAPTARMQYTGSSYVSPLMTLFRLFLRPQVRLHKPEGLFPRSAGYASRTLEAVSEYCYRPVLAGAAWIAMKLRRFQHGRIQFYVLYIALTVLILLLWKLGD